MQSNEPVSYQIALDLDMWATFGNEMKNILKNNTTEEFKFLRKMADRFYIDEAGNYYINYLKQPYLNASVTMESDLVKEISNVPLNLSDWLYINSGEEEMSSGEWWTNVWTPWFENPYMACWNPFKQTDGTWRNWIHKEVTAKNTKSHAKWWNYVDKWKLDPVNYVDNGQYRWLTVKVGNDLNAGTEGGKTINSNPIFNNDSYRIWFNSLSLVWNDINYTQIRATSTNKYNIKLNKHEGEITHFYYQDENEPIFIKSQTLSYKEEGLFYDQKLNVKSLALESFNFDYEEDVYESQYSSYTFFKDKSGAESFNVLSNLELPKISSWTNVGGNKKRYVYTLPNEIIGEKTHWGAIGDTGALIAGRGNVCIDQVVFEINKIDNNTSEIKVGVRIGIKVTNYYWDEPKLPMTFDGSNQGGEQRNKKYFEFTMPCNILMNYGNAQTELDSKINSETYLNIPLIKYIPNIYPINWTYNPFYYLWNNTKIVDNDGKTVTQGITPSNGVMVGSLINDIPYLVYTLA